MKVGRAARSKPLPLFPPPFPPPLHFLDHSLVAHSPYFSLSPPLPPALPPFLPLSPFSSSAGIQRTTFVGRERERGRGRKKELHSNWRREGRGRRHGKGREGESYFFLFSYPRPTRREGKRTEGGKNQKKGKSIRASKKPRPVSPPPSLPPLSRGRLCHSTPLPATLQAIFCR